MNQNNPYIKQGIIIVISVIIGLVAGYFLFPSNSPTEEHNHSESTEGEIWTCAMHPQIRQESSGSCPICGMDLTIASENNSSDPFVLEMSEQAVKLANIETSIIGKTGASEKEMNFSGKIQADERLAASQVAHIPGRIEKLFVTFTGEQVYRGQKLAVVYSPELVTAQKELLEALKLEKTNPSFLESARKKLEFWKIPPAKIKEIEESGKIEETFILHADASGVVTDRKVSVGDHIMQGEVLFDVINLNRVWVMFDAYEDDLANVKLGSYVEFTTSALPGKTFSTKINFIDPVIDPITRVASLRGEITNRSGQLKPEMFIRGTLQSKLSSDEQLMVPKSAVLWTGQRSVIYLKVQDASTPSFRYQEIVLGERIGNNYLVESGLNTGDEVVTYGSFTIDAAAQLNNQQSMINKVVNRETSSKTVEKPDFTADVSTVFKKQLGELVSTYLALKDALVATNSENAMEAIKPFSDQLKKIDMSLLNGESHHFWMDKLKALTAHSDQISKANEIEIQRTQFNFLSTALIEAVTVLGIRGNALYIQHCPMAMDNKGADWISSVPEIRNPYYGDAMLTCGSVTLEIGEE